MSSHCDTCYKSKATKAPTRNRSHKTRIQTQLQFQPGHDWRELKAGDVIALDIVYYQSNNRKHMGLFAVDVASNAVYFKPLPNGMKSVTDEIVLLIKRWRLDERTGMSHIRHDGDKALTHNVAKACQRFNSVISDAYPSLDPNLNPAERAWRHISAATRSSLIESNAPDIHRARAIRHAVLHHNFIPAPSRANARPIDVLQKEIRLFSHPEPIL